MVLERRFDVGQIGEILGQASLAEHAAESRIVATADFEAALEALAHAALAAQPVAGAEQGAGAAAAGLDAVGQGLFGRRQRRVGRSLVLDLTQQIAQGFEVALDEILLLGGLAFADRAGQGENSVDDVEVAVVVQRHLMAAPGGVNLAPERDLRLEFRRRRKSGVGECGIGRKFDGRRRRFGGAGGQHQRRQKCQQSARSGSHRRLLPGGVVSESWRVDETLRKSGLYGASTPEKFNAQRPSPPGGPNRLIAWRKAGLPASRIAAWPLKR